MNRQARLDIFGTQKVLYSQGDEELVARDYFQDMHSGVFADIGAGHPVNHSTTCFLERHLGWSGVAVDSLPEYGPLFAELRPKTHFSNYIVTDHSGTLENFYRVGAALGLSSTNPARRWGEQILCGEQIEVPTITLDDFFDAQGLKHIDFLSIDVEESPVEALASFTIARFRPALVAIEAGGRRSGRRAPIQAYFESNGYELISRYRQSGKPGWFYRPI